MAKAISHANIFSHIVEKRASSDMTIPCHEDLHFRRAIGRPQQSRRKQQLPFLQPITLDAFDAQCLYTQRFRLQRDELFIFADFAESRVTGRAYALRFSTPPPPAFQHAFLD